MCPTLVPTEGRATKSHQALSVTVRQAGPGRPALKVTVYSLPRGSLQSPFDLVLCFLLYLLFVLLGLGKMTIPYNLTTLRDFLIVFLRK